MRPLLALIPILVLLAPAVWGDQRDLGQVRSVFEEATARIDAEHEGAVDAVLERYLEGLLSLRDRARQAGDLNSLTSILEELFRAENERTLPQIDTGLPSVTVLVDSLQAAVLAADVRRAHALVTLFAQYDRALEAIQRGLVQANDIDAALAVRQERTNRAADTGLAAARELLEAHAARARPPAASTPRPPSIHLYDQEGWREVSSQFPPGANLGRGGGAKASSQYRDRDPDRVFGGERAGHSWTLNGPAGWFEAEWNPPVRGRHIVVFNRTSRSGADPWGSARILVNGRRIGILSEDFGGTMVMVVDLGASERVRSVRFEIEGRTYPGMAGLEIHP